jgi:arylsulfatase A-like enzyme
MKSFVAFINPGIIINLSFIYFYSIRISCNKTKTPGMMKFLHKIWIIVLSFFLISINACQSPKDESRKYNVLMICVDDLRPELGCYGNDIIHSPNINQLANEGLVFENHFVQSAACGPSRSMLLNSKITRKWDSWRRFRNMEAPPEEPVALPHLFKINGYHTVGIGKISHEPGGVMDKGQTIPQIPFSWDTTYTKTGQWGTPWKAFFAFADGGFHNKFRFEDSEPRIPYEAGIVDDTGYPDGLNAREAVRQLQVLSEKEQPFFLAVGFYKPHLPFNAPKKYWELYKEGEIPPADNNHPPKNLNNPYSVHNSYEVTTHYHWPPGPGNISPKEANNLKHAYYACVSYIDAQIGLILEELNGSGLSENTIVVLWSDHGWHLGEHDMFGKQTNFSIATRSPLIFKVPGHTKAGTRAAGLVETMDIYPTLAELCGLETPSDLEGESFYPVLKNPGRNGKPYARSFFKRDTVMGKTIVTDRYRVVRWRTENDSTVALELYDHKNDPGENRNIAYEYPKLTDSLLNILDQAYFADL